MHRIALADRRAALLAAATRVIARDGLPNASTRAIAAEAGMPTASVHYVFASHDALFAELVADILEEQRSHVVDRVAGVTTVREFAAAALQGWLDRAVAQPDVERALHELVGWARSVPGLEAMPAAVYEQYQNAVEGFVRAATERFGIRWRLPEAEVARFVLVLTDGVTARWLVDGDEVGARRALAVGAEAVLALVVPVRG